MSSTRDFQRLLMKGATFSVERDPRLGAAGLYKKNSSDFGVELIGKRLCLQESKIPGVYLLCEDGSSAERLQDTVVCMMENTILVVDIYWFQKQQYGNHVEIFYYQIKLVP